MRVKRLSHVPSLLWHVQYEGTLYYANSEELDLLWMGRTPTELELDLVVEDGTDE